MDRRRAEQPGPRSQWKRRIFTSLGGALATVGVLLLLLTASWYVVEGTPRIEMNEGVTPPPPDVATIRSPDTLVDRIRALEPQGDRATARVAYDLVRRRFDACLSRFTWQQNWIARLIGIVLPGHDPHTGYDLLAFSDCGLCSQVSEVLVLALTRLGVRARLISMPGHVVAEVFWDDAFHVVDPHFDYFPDDFGPSAAEMAADLVDTRARYARLLPERTVLVTVDSFRQFGAGAGTVRPEGTVSSPRLGALHRASAYAKWIVPLLLLFGGILLIRRVRSARGRD